VVAHDDGGFSSPPQVAAFLESARSIAHEQNWVCKSDGGDASEDWLSQADAPA
jgi:hypothetical protein